MPFRAPWTIWRLLGADLVRLVALTTGVLTMVIAFAASIKPLADGVLDPGQAIRFMLLAIPPMLQFALPFAAGFGATLAHHRFAADNEATAASAGGIAHRTMLTPALWVGLGLAVALGGLTSFVIPDFLRAMERLIARDIGRVLVNSIESGQAVRLPDGGIVHADAVIRYGPDAESGASDRLVLEGVLAVQVAEDGAIEWEATARRAVVWLFAGGSGTARETAVRLRLVDAVAPGRGQSGAIDLRFAAPGGFDDDPKFYSAMRMHELRDDPTRVGHVDSARRALAGEIERRSLERAVRTALEGSGAMILRDADGQALRVRAAGVVVEDGRWRLDGGAGGQPIELTWRLRDERVRLQTAERAWLIPGDAPPDDEGPSLAMALEGVETRDPGVEGGVTTRSSLMLAGLRLPMARSEAEMPARAPPAALLEMAERDWPDDDRIAGAADTLRDRLANLDREIVSKEQERFAASAACLVMVMAGAVAGLRLGESRPLLVYAWSFFPSILALITISAGQEVAHREGLWGIALLWSGVAGLAVFAIIEFLRLRRR